MPKDIKNKNIPKLRFPGFSTGWEEKRIGDITKINQGLQIPISERFFEKVENSYFYITNEFLKANSEKEYYIKNPPESVLCNEDDILMTRTGNTGHVVTNVSGAFHNNFFKIKYDKKQITKNFLYYFLVLPETKNFILRLAGTSTIPDLNHGDFYKIKINLPLAPEQQKITSFLESVDEWIESLRNQKENLEKYKKGIMQQIFSQKLRFSGFKDVWQEKKIGLVVDNFNNQRLPVSGEKRLKGEYPYYGANGIVDYVKEYIFDGEYVLVAEDGVVDVSKYPVHFVKGKFWVNNHAHVLQANNLMINKFLFYTLKNLKFGKYITGSAQTKLNTQVLNKILFRIPTLPEQQKIADFLTLIDYLIESKQEQITQAEHWKKGLMQGLFM